MRRLGCRRRGGSLHGSKMGSRAEAWFGVRPGDSRCRSLLVQRMVLLWVEDGVDILRHLTRILAKAKDAHGGCVRALWEHFQR